MEPLCDGESNALSMSKSAQSTLTHFQISPENHQDASTSKFSPKMTRVLVALQIIGTIFAQKQLLGKTFTDSFALLPMSTIGASKVWNVVTAGFFELDPLKAVVNVSLFLAVGGWIESAWGSSLFVLFVLLTNTVAGICTYCCMLGLYLVTRVDSFLFSPIGTTNGICVALLVGVKQSIPEHEIGFNGMRIATNFLPLIYVIIVVTLSIVGLISLGDLLYTVAAFQFSWLYLRFFQRRNGIRGDMSDFFSYASMFPKPLRSVVAILGNFVFVLLKPILMPGQLVLESDATNQAPVSKAASVDAERRRQRAIKALDVRMNTGINAEEKGVNAV